MPAEPRRRSVWPRPPDRLGATPAHRVTVELLGMSSPILQPQLPHLRIGGQNVFPSLHPAATRSGHAACVRCLCCWGVRSACYHPSSLLLSRGVGQPLGSLAPSGCRQSSCGKSEPEARHPHLEEKASGEGNSRGPRARACLMRCLRRASPDAELPMCILSLSLLLTLRSLQKSERRIQGVR